MQSEYLFLSLYHITLTIQYCRNLIFEKAYCYYRANKCEEALKTIDVPDLTEANPHIKELQAQIFYKLERYSEAASTYQAIIKNVNDEYEDERYTNLSATMVYLDPKENVNIVFPSALFLVYNFRISPLIASKMLLMNCATIRHVCILQTKIILKQRKSCDFVKKCAGKLWRMMMRLRMI